MSSEPDGLMLVSSFAGGGGSSCGYKAAGYDVRLAVEWDKKAAACYRLNFPGITMHEGDIAVLSGDEALSLAGLKAGELDVLDGSPPCQGFSTAGKRAYSDPRNSLFREYVRLLHDFQPKAFVMENVSGLIKGKMRIAFAEITRTLRSEGYRVSCRLLNAWWYGVPQDRRRLIWIGIRNDLNIEPSHPAPTCIRPVSVAEAIGPGQIKNALFNNAFRSGNLPSPALCAASPPLMLIEHHPGYRNATFKQGPSPTLSASRRTRIGFGDGNTEARYLTIEEAKILQGFPPSFIVDEYRIIGNSVPPPMAEAIGRHIAMLLLQQGREAPTPALHSPSNARKKATRAEKGAG